MSLSPGDRIGVYEVIAAVGKGGMGEVYRARDTKLQRDVAIKVLPIAVSRLISGCSTSCADCTGASRLMGATPVCGRQTA